MNIDIATVEVIKCFIIEKLNPEFIYLLGSAVEGNFREDSDIDIAFLSEDTYSAYEIFMMGQQLADLLKREVDLLDIKQSSTVFKAQIVGKGQLIYCKDEYKKAEFEIKTWKEYEILNKEREEIIKNIQREGKVYDG